MKVFTFFANASQHKLPWLVLFLSTLGLELAALYFQYMMGLKPCIMCIYQRTAVFGLMLASIVGLMGYQFNLGRLTAMAIWAISAIWGGIIAWEHVDIQQAANPFFATCEIVPNFPSWLQLHEWLPSIFAATGDCGDIDWQFLGMSMPQWMLVIFGIYTALFALTLSCQLWFKKRI